MSVTVRPARRDELDRVNALRRMVNDVHVEGRPDIFRPGFNEALQQHVYEQFDSEDSDVIVALVNGEICGFATVEYIHRPESPYSFARDYYHLQEFGVDPAFHRIELDAWAFNTGALAFYEAAGFKTFRRFFEMDV